MIDQEIIKLLTFSVVAFLYISWKLQAYENTIMANKIIGVNFEVYGRVQGVFFRKYTKKRSEELGLKGWCMNTEIGTVVGRVEGEKSKIEEMKHWLQHKGSPQSAIEKVVFRDEQELSQQTFSDFRIRR